MNIKDIQLVASKKDIAGSGIASNIKNSKVIMLDGETIYSDEELKNKTDLSKGILFLSRHTAKSLRPSFTVHPIGNFGNATFGGNSNQIVSCNSFLLKYLLLNIQENHNTNAYDLLYDYEISIEATHHGPYIDNSVGYIEVGSSENQWRDNEACRLIAEAVDNLSNVVSKEWISVIGFGGNHYSTKFTKLILEQEYAFGHVCAKYAVNELNTKLIEQMIKKTNPKPQLAIFDKKSMKRKVEIRSLLKENDLDVIQV